MTSIRSFLPEGFTVNLDVDALEVLAQPHTAAGAATAVVGRSTAHNNRGKNAAAVTTQPHAQKRGKRKGGASTGKEAAAGTVSNRATAQALGDTGKLGSKPLQGGRGRGLKRAAAASDDGWESDTGEGHNRAHVGPGTAHQLPHTTSPECCDQPWLACCGRSG